MDIYKLLEESSLKIDIELSEKQIKQFLKYKDLLLEWNSKINLTAITEDYDIIMKHFIDSISCLTRKEFVDKCSIIDIGTGAGFPGIPIKIVRPDIQMTLLDSLKKRISFLDEVIKNLDLSDINTIHARAEDVGNNKSYRESYDIAISRAVSNLSVLAEYTLPMVKTDGYFISMKGPDAEEEVKQAQNAIKILGGELVEQTKVQLPGTDIVHSLIVIKKIKMCPTKYPRKAGKPAKDPLK